MSSDDELHDGDDLGYGPDDKNKKRRIQRACDTCRRKKIRCDGAQMVDNRCTNCITWNLECTYVEAAKKRGPPKGYVESLENRLEKMEKLLRSLCPDADFTKELGTFIDRETWYHERSANKHGQGSSSSLPRREVPSVGGMRATANSKVTEHEEDIPASDEEFMHVTLAEGLKHLTVNVNDRRFHGKSSGIMLVQAAMDFKREYSGTGGEDEGLGASIPDSRREEFWTSPEWENSLFDDVRTPPQFPADDLVRSLFDKYFEYTHPFYPLHHRPTLERHYSEGLHHTDSAFAATLLLTCAVASRWSDDPRVLVDEKTQHSAGWHFFEQAQALRRNALVPPTLFDVQVYALSALFLTGSSAPSAAWTMIGIGIRLGQDVGAHRRKVYNAATAIEDEQWKRVFWTLVSLDRGVSSALGRPCAIQDEDFDLDHPLEVDDEYWETPEGTHGFKQPSDKPPKVAFFNCYLKLNQILAFALRTIYSINKSKILLGFVGPQWEQHIVAELDSALNKWIDSVPDHLRWDPNREDQLFFAQSATLYATYYHLQILIHRPFIPTPRKPSPLSFPSLAICTNAARSCSHVLDVARRRMKMPNPINMAAAFTSGIVLLLNIWGAKKSGMQNDPVKQMADVHKCMQHLKDIETRFRAAGRLWDILYELASVGELPLPQTSPSGSNGYKRPRGSDTPISRGSVSGHSEVSLDPNAPRPVAHSKATRIQRNLYNKQTPTPPLNAQPGAPAYPIMHHPVSSVDLGRLPLNPEAVYNTVPSTAGPAPPPTGNIAWDYQTMSQPPPITGSTSFPDQPVYGSSNYNDLFQHQPPAQAQPPAPMYPEYPQHPQPPQHPSSALHHHPYGGAPGQAEYMNPVWSNAPTSFEIQDWNAYVSGGIDPNTGLLMGMPSQQNLHGHGH